METSKAVKFTFEITRYPDKEGEKKIKIYFTLFIDDKVGLVITSSDKERKITVFEDVEDLKLRGRSFGLTSEDIMIAPRILV